MKGIKMREDRIRCDNELDIGGVKATFINASTIKMQKYINKTGKLVIVPDPINDATNFVFYIDNDIGIVSEYLIEVLNLENTIIFTTQNSTYTFKKELDV